MTRRPRPLVEGECYICGGKCRFGAPKKKGEPCLEHDPHTEPDWQGKCSVCGESPTVPQTGMCGPCTFGEADTVGGNW